MFKKILPLLVGGLMLSVPFASAAENGLLHGKKSTSDYWDALSLDSSGNLKVSVESGGVTAASTFGTDNVYIRSDGTGKGVQASQTSEDDSGNVTLAGTLTVGGSGNDRLTFNTNSEYIDNTADDFILFQGVGGTDNTNFRVDLDGNMPIFSSPQDTGVGFSDNVYLTEKSAGEADVAGRGQFWVKDSVPNIPYFTDDTGVDNRLGVGNTFCVNALNNASSSTKCSMVQCSSSNYEQDRLHPIPTGGTFSNLRAVVIGAPDNGVGTQGWDFTLRVNDSASALTCDIEESATTCSDTTNTVTVSAGDLIGFNITPSGSPANGTSEGACFQFNAS